MKGYSPGYSKAIKALRVRLKARSRTDEKLAEAIPARGHGLKRFKERGTLHWEKSCC